MRTLNLRDRCFRGDDYSARKGSSRLLAWDRDCGQPGPVVYTDAFLGDRLLEQQGDKIAWLLEPHVINPLIYPWIRLNFRHFQEVWTHDEETLSAVANGRYVPMAGTWIAADERRIFAKSQLCSFVASAKNTAPGHRFRQRVRRALPDWVDKYGTGFHFVPNKVDTLKDYCFSIAIENCVRDAYFTEKLIDCFNTGTVPIYWGTRTVAVFFDPDGVIQFEELDDLLAIVEGLKVEDYERRLPAIMNNLELAREFEVGEDWHCKDRNLYYDRKNALLANSPRQSI